MKIVIDASVGIHTVLDTKLNEQIDTVWEFWRDHQASLYVPGLWLNEVTSVIHRIHMLGEISEEKATDALNAVLGLDIEVVPETDKMCLSAFKWASRLGQHASYDGFYLALSEDLEAEFWSADQRLVNRSNQVGITWAHSISEIV
jgi:predicted nucleic acid-binding protein